MGHDVRLGELATAARPKLRLELVEEPEVQVHQRVVRAVERADLAEAVPQAVSATSVKSTVSAGC